MGWTTKEMRFNSQHPKTSLGTNQPPIQWVSGAISPGVRQPGHEADHLPQSTAKVKNV